MDELLYEKILSGEISLEVDESIINEKTLEEIAVTTELKSWIKEMSDDEVDSLFPQDEEMTEKEAQWLFGDDAKTFSDSLASRRKTRFNGNYNTTEKSEKAAGSPCWDGYEQIGMKKGKNGRMVPNCVPIATEKKAANNPVLRDPDGGLTAAGRAHFNKTEGSNLKPGVKGPADTPDKMRRKGSFLARFFTNPRGPMKDEKGRPTRLALSASAWGEPVPQTVEAAQRLAEKGQNLLARYRRYKEAGKGKKSLAQFDYEVKALGAPVAQQSGTVGSRQAKPAAGGSQKPRTISGGGASGDTYNPKARDMDGDGNVQEGTDFMRAADPRPTTTDRDKQSRRADKRTGENEDPPASAITDITMPKADIEKAIREGRATRDADGNVRFNRSRTWDTESGSADTRERAIIRDNLEGMGFDGEAFRKLIDAESRKLKPGQKTNWNPGRLPNGGKIAADGTYIPPDMVREDDKKASDYYRERRERRAKERERTPRTGTADSMERNAPRTPRSGTADSMERNAPPTTRPKITRDGDVLPDKNRDRRTPPTSSTPRSGSADSMERNAPRTPRSGSADSMERNAPRTPRSGSADAQERRSEAEERRRTGKGQGFDKIETEEEMNTYRNSYLNPKNKPRNI